MKNYKVYLFSVLFLVVNSLAVLASSPMRSMTLGGATGLITLPTARTGWDSGTFGVDMGYHFIGDDGNTSIPKIQFNILNRFEIGGAYDTQVENGGDLLLNAKLRFFPWLQSYSHDGTSLALGGNYQKLKGPAANGTSREDTALQVYLATSYGGNIFGWASETSFAVGKTFSDNNNSNIDFSMGFNLAFIPSIFKGYLNWITDFGNFSYSLQAYGARASRGILNTGLRLDLLKGFSEKIHLKIDLLFLDALDETRSWGAGFNFGMLF